MSKPVTLDEIQCSFNIFDNGRKYSGQDRGYVLDNVSEVLNSGFSKERIKHREAVGYYSHGIRRLAGLDPEETTSVMVNNKPMIINATPSNLTVSQSIDSDGNIRHTQQILDNDEGRKALGLHNSKVGGFSWACSPANSSGGGTRIAKFYGYDYVRNPLFVRNRGHVLDSVADQDQMILDSMLATGLDANKARQAVDDLLQDAILDAEHYRDQLESAILDRGILDAALAESKSAASKLNSYKGQIEALTAQIESDKALRGHILDNVATQFNIGSVSQEIRGQVLDGSPEGLDALFSLVGRTTAKAHSLGGSRAESVNTASLGEWGAIDGREPEGVSIAAGKSSMRSRSYS